MNKTVIRRKEPFLGLDLYPFNFIQKTFAV